MSSDAFNQLVDMARPADSTLRSLVMQADAPSSIMRFVASDLNVAHCVRGVVLEDIVLLTGLAFCADNRVV